MVTHHTPTEVTDTVAVQTPTRAHDVGRLIPARARLRVAGTQSREGSSSVSETGRRRRQRAGDSAARLPHALGVDAASGAAELDGGVLAAAVSTGARRRPCTQALPIETLIRRRQEAGHSSAWLVHARRVRAALRAARLHHLIRAGRLTGSRVARQERRRTRAGRRDGGARRHRADTRLALARERIVRGVEVGAPSEGDQHRWNQPARRGANHHRST